MKRSFSAETDQLRQSFDAQTAELRRSMTMEQAQFEEIKKKLQEEQAVLSEQQLKLKADLAEQKRARAAAGQRWTSGTIANVFRRWSTYTRTAKSQKKQTLDRMLKRMTQQSLWSAWRTWLGYIESHKVSEMKRSLRSELEGELRAKMSKLRQQVSTRALAQTQRQSQQQAKLCFIQWKVWAKQQRQRKRTILDKYLKRLQQTELWR